MYLKVLQGELQHVSEDITEDLRLPLHQHILIVQRLNHLWFDLQKMNERKKVHFTILHLAKEYTSVTNSAGILLSYVNNILHK